jgi:4-hydroxy-2-oxoheptanedioate aldolase
MLDIRQHFSDSTPILAINPGGAGLAVSDALPHYDNAATALFIDCERTAIGITEAAQMARAARAKGLNTLIRTETDAPGAIVRYLDCGIDALVVPQVESSVQCRLLGQLFANHSTTFARTAFIAQIESVAGHAALDEIMKDPYVDAVLIGPNDLSASMGLAGQPAHPEVLNAVDDIATRLKAYGMPFGLPVTPVSAQNWSARGARLFYITLAQILAEGLGSWKEDNQ